ncbi:hypothetical protein H7I94_01135 [Mycobacterium szulgai]|nr:hypothetical protein [Mycobacterium szulgai]MCV7074510.1 hypothetical protein [Mycobacterium szulgai]
MAADTVDSAGPSRRWRSPRLAAGALLVVMLAGGLAFVAVHSTRHDNGAAAPGPASPSAAAPPASIGVAIPGCYNRSVPPADRPVKLNIVGCGSAAVALQDMSWRSWGPQGADGTGTAVFKICQPNCANGSRVTDQVVIHAWNPQPPRTNSGCPAGLKVFADLILAFPNGVPPAAAQEMNTDYTGMPAVHYTNYFVTGPRDGQFIGYTFCS